MDHVYERKHTHTDSIGTGLMIATVTEDAEGQYGVSVRCYAPNGRAQVIGVGTGGSSGFQSLAEAQRGADAEISRWGHECSVLCEQWPRA